MVIQNIIDLVIPSLILAIVMAIGVGISLKIFDSKAERSSIFGVLFLIISIVVSSLLIWYNVYGMKGLWSAEGVVIYIMSIILGITIVITSGMDNFDEGELYPIFGYIVSFAGFTSIYIVTYGLIGINIWTIVLTSAIGGFFVALSIKALRSDNRESTDHVWSSILVGSIGLIVLSVVIGIMNDVGPQSAGALIAPTALLGIVIRKPRYFALSNDVISSCESNPNQKICKKICGSNPKMNFCK